MAMKDYLAQPVSRLLESPPFRDWRFDRSVEDDLDEPVVSYVFEGQGLEIRCDENENVVAIFLCKTEHGGPAAALSEIPFSLTRDELVRRLGRPSKSGEGLSDPVLGEYGPWDRFLDRDVTTHVEYGLDGVCIDKVTLMLSDTAP